MPPTLQPLTSVALGATATVAEIKLPPESRPRLMEMGLLVGTPVELVRFAPLGDPVEIKVRGYNLTLRKHEAEQILVQAECAKPDASGSSSARTQPSRLPTLPRPVPHRRLRDQTRSQVGPPSPAYVVLTGQSQLRQDDPVQRADRPARQGRQLRRRDRRAQGRPPARRAGRR